MKLRTLVIAVGLLAVLAAVAFLGNRPAPAPVADPRVGTPLLAPDTAQKAAGLSVSDQGKRVDLARDAKGTWIVKDYYGLPADFDKIARLVQDLNEAKVERFVTESPERLAHLDFKDSAISLEDAAGKAIWSLTLGKSSDNGNGKFIRFGTEKKAFFSTLHVWLDTDPKAWADTRLVTVQADDVASVRIPFDGGAAVVLTRAKKGAPWTATGGPEGQRLSEAKVSPVLAALTGLRFSETTEPESPAAAEAARHARTLTLTTFAGKTLSIAIGRKPEEKRLKAPSVDAKAAVAALAKPVDGKPADAKPSDVKAVLPEFETIPAGPVFVSVTSSDPADPVNASMKARAFQVEEFSVSSVPQKAADLFEPAPAK